MNCDTLSLVIDPGNLTQTPRADNLRAVTAFAGNRL